MRRLNLLLTTSVMLAASSCPAILFPERTDAPRVEITADGTTASPDAPITLTVTASNPGSRRVTWGPGSSTCQLGAVADVGGEELLVGGSRACTMDLRTHALEPGESRTESFEWDGRVATGEGSFTLEPGSYELRGVALPTARSAPITVTVTAEGG